MFFILFIVTYSWAAWMTYRRATYGGSKNISAALQAIVWPYTEWLNT